MAKRNHRPMVGKEDRYEPTEFCGEVKWETEKALLVYDGAEEVWLPKSQIMDKKEISPGNWEFTIPRWLAEEKGII